MFRYQGGFLQNERGKVMDVHGARDEENRDIIVWNKHGRLNQQWDLIFANKWREPKKGQLNKDFGLYVDRTFYIISVMGKKRYLDLVGRDLVIKTRNGRNTQQWYFHQQSLTVRSRSNNQSWDIKSSGRTNHMQVWSTSSRWW
jgi:membrane carboxypeptidase/penicillin-binding protein PbpC